MRRLSIRRIKILEKVRQIIRIQLEFELKFMWQQLFSSVQFSRSVVSDSLRPHESQHARPPCPSPTPGVHSDSRLSSQWCHSAISSSVVPFSSCPQSLPASKSFPMSQLFAWGGQFPIHHQLPEFTQTHVHWVGDAIQPSHPLSSPFPLVPNPSQYQSLFQWVNSLHEVAKVLELQL